MNREALYRFGNHLTALREERKLTVSQLAAAAGLDEEEVLRIEAGAEDCSITTMMALAKALGLSAGELLRSF
jgi:transcriptional regulator with XRE-family HTH domain